ncbi:putative N6-adenine methyltransferase-domain-containing protein [Lentinula raphanica]|nr:putative N6-adenine methyltransferase-domain-containing protein [Lentinula raphanica]
MSTALDINVPDSPRSVCSSNLSGSPPTLDSSTLSILDSFLSSKLEEENFFNELSARAPATALAGLSIDDHSHEEEDDDKEPQRMLSVDEYRIAFGEDWQLSQFWYTTPFANHLAICIHSLCDPSTVTAFVCCPTAFVAFQHLHPDDNARLLEFDRRFSVLSPKKFVPYDLNEPDIVPDSLKHAVDIAVVDPPYLNERTNKKLAQTLRQILRPNGKLIIITSKSVESALHETYNEAPLGPLRETALVVEHSRLANDFACWGSWDDAQHFGKEA